MRKMRISVNYADPHRRILSDAMKKLDMKDTTSSRYKRSRFNVLLGDVNFGFWSHLECSGQNAIIIM